MSTPKPTETGVEMIAWIKSKCLCGGSYIQSQHSGGKEGDLGVQDQPGPHQAVSLPRLQSLQNKYSYIPRLKWNNIATHLLECAKHQMLPRMWSNQNSSWLLTRVKNGTATWKALPFLYPPAALFHTEPKHAKPACACLQQHPSWLTTLKLPRCLLYLHR